MTEEINKGLRWTFLGKIFSTLFSIAFSLIILKFLDPKVFGILAMALTFIGLMRMFNSFATDSSIVSRDEFSHSEFSTLIWGKVLFSILLILLTLIFSGSVAKYYQEEGLKIVLYLLSLSLLFEAPSFVYFGKMRRSMKFKETNLVRFFCQVASSIVCLVMVVKGYGIYSLVVKEVLNNALTLLFLCIISGEVPSLVFKLALLRYHVSFGSDITINGIFAYFTRTIDDILIGGKFSSNDLGLYNRSYGLLVFPLTIVSKTFTNVLLPEFSKNKNSSEKVSTLYLETSRIVLGLTIPLCLMLYFTIEPIFTLLEYDEWLQMVPLVKVFALVSLLQALGPVGDLIFQGLSKTRVFRNYEVIKNCIVVFFFIVATYCFDSIYEITLAYGILNIFTFFAGLFFLSRVSGINFGILLKNILPLFISSILCFLLLLVVSEKIESNSLIQVISYPILIMVSFSMIYYFVSKSYFLEMVVQVKKLIKF